MADTEKTPTIETTGAAIELKAPDPMDPQTDDHRKALQNMIDGVEEGLASPDPEEKLPKIAEDQVRAVLKDAKEAVAVGDDEVVSLTLDHFRDTMRNAAAAYNATIDPTKIAPATGPFGTPVPNKNAPKIPTPEVIRQAEQLGDVAKHVGEPEGETVHMLFPHEVRLRINSETVLTFPAGLQSVPVEYADHDYLRRNKVMRPVTRQAGPSQTLVGNATKTAQ